MRRRFGAAVDAALDDRLGIGWAQSPLALLLLLDQFTRNLFRGSARAFAGDARALSISKALVATGADRRFDTIERGFVYLPFEHAEDLAAQDEAVRLFTALAAEDPRQADSLDYAHRHRDVIRRFGRFPHRNAALGRASSAEEQAWLALPGSGF